MKFFFFTLLVQLPGFGGPAFAQELNTCNVKTFAKVYIVVDKATNAKKDQAIAELKKARAKMAEGDDDACLVHLANATDMAAAE